VALFPSENEKNKRMHSSGHEMRDPERSSSGTEDGAYTCNVRD